MGNSGPLIVPRPAQILLSVDHHCIGDQNFIEHESCYQHSEAMSKKNLENLNEISGYAVVVMCKRL